MSPTPVPACTHCGGPATVETATLDPRHPLGHCLGDRNDGERAPKRRILTLDPDEAYAILVRVHRRNMTRQHKRHDPDHRTSASCDKCVAAGWVTARTDPGTIGART